MKLSYNTKHDDNKYEIDVFIKSFGTNLLTPEEEKNILSNYNRVIQYKNINFSGYYKIDVNKDPIKVDVIEKNNAKLDILIPTNYGSGSSVGEITVTIGTKVITVTPTETSGTSEYTTEINNAVFENIKNDTNILAIYESSDLSLNNGHIIANKELETIDNTKINAINSELGNVVEIITTTIQNGIKVTLNLINKKLLINDEFKAHAEITLKDIKDSEIPSGYTNDQIAEMKMILFKDKIYEAVMNEVKDMKDRETDFENEEYDRDSEEF